VLYNTQGQNYIFAWVQGSLVLHSCIHFGVISYITFCIHFLYHERSPWLQVFVIVQNLISFTFESLCLVICKFYSKIVVRTKETTIQEALLLPWNHRSCHKVLPQIHTATIHAEWALELHKSSFQSSGWYISMELDLQPPINSYQSTLMQWKYPNTKLFHWYHWGHFTSSWSELYVHLPVVILAGHHPSQDYFQPKGLVCPPELGGIVFLLDPLSSWQLSHADDTKEQDSMP
jgi:hypothetical protein